MKNAKQTRQMQLGNLANVPTSGYCRDPLFYMEVVDLGMSGLRGISEASWHARRRCLTELDCWKDGAVEDKQGLSSSRMQTVGDDTGAGWI